MTHNYKDDLYWIITNGHFDENDTAKLTECMHNIEHALQMAQEAEQVKRERDELAKAVDNIRFVCCEPRTEYDFNQIYEIAKKVRSENG